MRPYIHRVKETAELDWNFVHLCWEREFREYQYVGVEYIMKLRKNLKEQDLDQLEYFIGYKSWWDITAELDKVNGFLSDQYESIDERMIWHVKIILL